MLLLSAAHLRLWLGSVSMHYPETSEMCHGVKYCACTVDDEAESLLPTRRSSRITQRRHRVSEPLPGFPTHLPAGAYMASQGLALPPLSMPSASGVHPCETLKLFNDDAAFLVCSGAISFLLPRA